MTRMHSSRMRTVRNSSRLLGWWEPAPGGLHITVWRGVSLTETSLPQTETARQRATWTEIPLGQRPPNRDLSGQRPHGQRPPWTDPWTETSLDRPMDRDPLGQRPHRQRHSPWTESQTGVKTLPCRNFVANGNKLFTPIVTKWQPVD